MMITNFEGWDKLSYRQSKVKEIDELMELFVEDQG